MNPRQRDAIRHMVASGDLGILMELITSLRQADLESLVHLPPDEILVRRQGSVEAYTKILALPDEAERQYQTRNEDI